MFDLGDELTIESYRVPWLIWIQLVVLFLLIFLIYCFTNLSDNPNSNSFIASSSSSKIVSNDTQKDKRLPKHNFTTRVVTNLYQNHRNPSLNWISLVLLCRIGFGLIELELMIKAAESQSIKGEFDASTSRRVERRGEDLADNEDYSGANTYFQPCHYFRLVSLAFLKCFGLDCSAENSSTLRRRKKKEQ